MTNEITITLTRHAIHRVVAKLLLILAVGLLSGYLYDQTVAPDNAEAQELTLDEYTANFETYKASLQEEDWGTRGAPCTVCFCLWSHVRHLRGNRVGPCNTLWAHSRDCAQTANFTAPLHDSHTALPTVVRY